MKVIYTLSCVALTLSGVLIGTAHAQASRVDFSAGGGFSVPTGRMGNNVDTGWNFDVRGGYKPSRNIALDLDFNYNRWNLNSTALASVGEPDGYTTIWSVSFTPVLKGSPHWHLSPYILGGPGLYYRNLTLTQPGVVNTIICDPFFGYCFTTQVGVDQVVASSTTYKMGVNGGAGIEFRLGESHLKAFGEARYSRMFTTHGDDMTFVPVTFGLRW
jgi:opacity protein-like surface antigen